MYRSIFYFCLIFCSAFFSVKEVEGQTCIFDTPIIASNNPFASCPPGTDTIIIRNTFEINIGYEPLFGGIPFQGILIVDGGTINWTSPVAFRLGFNAKVVLINNGRLLPEINSTDCNRQRRLFFDSELLASCSGSPAPHAFTDVNQAGCINVAGICCNAFIYETDNSGLPNDFHLCSPGDTAILLAEGSGQLNYSYFWIPNLGPDPGPYVVTPTQNTNYTVNITGLFDPYVGDPYVLTCSGTVTIRINPKINLSATTNTVPCLGSSGGIVDLTVTGGTAPFKYQWSNNATTQDLNNVPGGTYHVTVTDAKECSEMLTVTIPVQDNVPPTITCPGNAVDVADPGLCTTLVSGIDAVITDNCPTVLQLYSLSGATTGNGNGQLSDLLPFNSGVTTVTYIADDGANTASCTFTVTVNDTQFPTATNPDPVSGIQCLASIPAPNPAVVDDAADNCGPPAVTFLNDVNNGNSGCPGDTLVVTRTYRVADAAGNSIQVTQLIRIVDNQPPTFTSIPPDLSTNCQNIPAVGTPAATDNCAGPVTITYNGETRINGVCPNTYTLERRWTASDACGNSTQALQVISVLDVTPPVVTFVPPAVTVECNAIPTPGTPTASDNCTSPVTVTYNGETRTDGSCPHNYTLRRLWTASDECGNTVTMTQIITVVDQTAPFFTSVPDNVTVSCEAIPTIGTATASDNCSASVAVVFDGEVRTNGSCPDNYVLTRRWVATDACGNTALATQTVTVRDVTPPVFTFVPADALVNCESVPPVGTPAASDNCTANVSVAYNGETRTNGPCPNTYTLRREWTATDACGNTAVATQTLNVQDNKAPVFNFVPANVTVSCESVPPVGTPSATDNCTAAVLINYDGETRIDGSCLYTYTLERRWTAADECGNTQTALQVITVRDITAPLFTFVPGNVTVSCENIPPVGTPSAADNCAPVANIVYNGETRANGPCDNSYTLRRRWTASDACGNTRTAEQIISVIDDTPPVFTTVPANTTVSCESVPAIGAPLATDNCDATVDIQYDGETRVDGSCPFNYTLTRQWTAVDNCGNVRTTQQVITVEDLTPPAFTFIPVDVTVDCDDVPQVGTPLATDNCTGSVTITFNDELQTSGPCTDTYTLRRQWTASDACGNTATAEQFITVQDTTLPVFTFVPANVTVSCEVVPPVGTPQAADNCATSIDITYDGEVRVDGACPNAYQLTRQWTATDICGNTVTATQVITVTDVFSPIFTQVPPNVTVDCESIPPVGTPAAVDNCSVNVSIAFDSEVRIDGSCADSYFLRRIWIASDECGNTASAEQVIAVQDTTKPVFTFVPADTLVNCDAVPPPGNPVAADNCSVGTAISFVGETRTDGACPFAYTLRREWRATDQCGNQISAVQILTVQDTVSPVFTVLPPDLTVDCDAIPSPAVPTATDNCTAQVAINYDGEIREDGSCPNQYRLLRRWTASDECGNTRSYVQALTVQDTTKPVFTLIPPDVTVNCDDVPGLGNPEATDNCTAVVSIVFDDELQTSGPCADTYTLLRRWIASDECGNTATAQQLITVQDTSLPVFTFVPANLTVSCDAIPPVGTPEAADNCASAIDIQYDGETRINGACNDSYTLRRQWTATDICGNTVTAEQILVVQDNTLPVFTFVPADTVVNCDAIPPPGLPEATDNCAAQVFIAYTGETRADGACPDAYTLTRRWTALDNCGNLSTAEQVLTVQDTTKPEFTFIPPDLTVNCEAIPSVGVPSATDNCTVAPTISYLGEIRVNGACTDDYTLRRQWRVVDACGNESLAEQTITVQDTTKPVFTSMPPDLTVDCDAVPPVTIPGASDNCDADVTVIFGGQEQIFDNCTDNYTLRRSWVAFDNCGNTAETEQLITVRDTAAPVFTFVPPNTTVNCDAVPPPGVPEASDNCAQLVAITFIGEQRTDGSCPDTYTLVREWMAMDNCGNSTSTFQVITVQDTTRPVFTFVPTNQLVNCDAIPPAGTPLASDNCDDDVLITYQGEQRTDGFCADSYILTRRWTAIDDCGNSTMAVQVLTVQDTTKPVFTFVPADTLINCDAVPAPGLPQAADNCDGSVLISYDGEVRTDGPCPNSFVLQRQWTAVDNCSNSTTRVQTITVQDTIRPEFVLIPADTVVNCDAVPDVPLLVASDNCDSDVTVAFDGETVIAGICPDSYTLERRWTATDDCGNTRGLLQVLTVQDTTRPVFTLVPPDITVDCEAIPSPGMAEASDNCAPNPSVVYAGEERTDGACPGSFTLLRMWVAFDRCGNTAVANQTITVQDTTRPVFTFVPLDLTVDCEAVPPPDAVQALDNCDADLVLELEEEIIQGSCPGNYTLIRTWTAIDFCGNSRDTVQTITVQDTTRPVFTFVPPTENVQCDNVPDVGTPVASDNCDPSVNIVYEGVVRTDGVCPYNYTLQRMWRATDHCGNSTTAEQILTVQDTIFPEFTYLAADITVSCDAIPEADTAAAVDNCADDVIITYDGEIRFNGNCEDGYTLERYWTAVDDCGNAVTRTQTITVIDTTPPYFTLVPADTTVPCDAIPAPGFPEAADNCDPDVFIEYQGDVIMSSTSPDSYVLKRSWSATDNCGNQVLAEQILTVLDTIAPGIVCPGDISALADAATCMAVIDFDPPVISDNCSDTLLVTSTANSGDAFPIGLTEVIISVEDASGNMQTCSFLVSVADTTAPVMVTCPDDITLTIPDSTCTAVPLWEPPIVSDPCDQYLIIATPSIPPGSVFNTGITTVLYTAVDSSGNSSTCTFTVRVDELVPPSIGNCPPDQTLLTDTCSAPAFWALPVASDNCNLDTLTGSHQPGDVFPEGTTVVVYTATDIWGNSTTCSFSVTVIDTVDPTFSGCPQDTVVDAKGACEIAVNFVLPQATDNCAPDPVITASPMPGTIFPVGFTNVFIFVTDPSGNQDTCRFTVSVIGPPLGWTAVPDDLDFVDCEAIATWDPPTPTGVCGPIDIESTFAPGDTFPIGTTTVVYTVKDTLGNSATTSFTISVTESIPPQMFCPYSPIVVDISGAVLEDIDNFILATDTVSSCDGIELQFNFPESTDNCGAPDMQQLSGIPSGAVFPIADDHVLEFVATDAAGNSVNCLVRIVVQPLQPLAPVISDVIGCPGDDVSLSATIYPDAEYTWFGPNGPYPSAPTLLIENLSEFQTGYYSVQANLNGCITPLDSALVRIGMVPDAADDVDIEVEPLMAIDSLNVLLNDVFELDDYDVTLLSPLEGLSEIGEGIFRYEAGKKSTYVNFIYQLCSATCPDLCDEAVVTIQIRETICTYIPNVITPNGDGVNDFLEIPCLDSELYPDNSLIIYNQWGDKVFEAAPYSNDPMVAWRGTFEGKEGKDLPDATYFYIFKASPDGPTLKGFVEILR